MGVREKESGREGGLYFEVYVPVKRRECNKVAIQCASTRYDPQSSSIGYKVDIPDGGVDRRTERGGRIVSKVV